MPTAFIEVLKDLWDFANPKQFLLSSSKHSPDALVGTQTAPTSVQTEHVTPVVARSLESRVCFVNTAHLLCLQTPQKKFDSLRGAFKYGDAVKVLQQKDNWSFVENSTTQGWVVTQYLTEDAMDVFPDLQPGEVYEADNQETKKLRLYINDSLLGGDLRLALKSSEYIFYRLQRTGIHVQWPFERPRLPGTWHTILSGKQGVSIGIEPKTGSVLEYVGSEGEPSLAYVETVTPREDILLSGIYEHETGLFQKNEYTKEQWSKWKPVFISFT